MAITLYSATVPRFIQMIGSTATLLRQAEAFCAGAGLAEDEILQARLAPDMLPFAYQVKSVAVHSWGAMLGARAGRFTPDGDEPERDFAGLRARLAAAREALAGLDEAEVKGLAGRDVTFEVGDYRAAFTAEDFLLGFSLPNVCFHVTTAYAILRARGVEIGKRHYLGRLPVKA